MAHLRATTRLQQLPSGGVGAENAGQLSGKAAALHGLNPGKTAAGVGGNVRVTRGALAAAANHGGRAALGDVGNKAAGLALRGQNAGQPPIKKEIAPRKPGRGLARQKASTTLKVAAPAPEPMEMDEGPTLHHDKENDVEMLPSALPTVSAEASGATTKTVELAQVEDIDRDDRDNPQLAVDFVNEVYAYMRELEARQAIAPNYLEKLGNKVPVKPKMRNLLVDWLVEVHQQFSLLQETLYLTVALLDRFLQVRAATVTTKQLQLVGVTAMFIASKYEEMYPPEIGDFVYITDKAYTQGQIRRMEIAMLEALDFDLGRPLPINFLRRNSKAGLVDAQAHALAKYVMELTLVDYGMAHVAPSVVAVASLALSMRVLDSGKRSLRQLWTPTLQFYTSYAVEDFAATLAELAALVSAAAEAARSTDAAAAGSKNLRAVVKKYSHKKSMKVALIPDLRHDVLKRMAEGEI